MLIMKRLLFLLLAILLFGVDVEAEETSSPVSSRMPEDEASMKRWLENMVWHHGFDRKEVCLATGLEPRKAADYFIRFNLLATDPAVRQAGEPLLALPYPGGRHPRIGFLDGAIDPQRETKVSVFLPWDPSAYVVADVPEAIWWEPGKGGDGEAVDRELLYLAHTHVPTHWTKRGLTLDPLEWKREKNGSLVMERTLPNGIRFGTRVIPKPDHVLMEQWLFNGTEQPLTGLRVQNCVMLKGAPEFADQTQENKVFHSPYAACRNPQGTRWVITAWTPCLRPWGNERCPCLHSDPQFPDCPPGETVRLRGWLSFYEGKDIEGELERIEASGWAEREPGKE